MSKGRHALETIRGLRSRTKAAVVGLLVVPLVAATTVTANALTQDEIDSAGQRVSSTWFDVCVSPEGRVGRFLLEGQSCGGNSVHLRWAGSKHPRLHEGVVQVESDGPYPGATDLGSMDGQGDNSEAKWVGDGGAELQTSWVQCAGAKIAIGGGFSRADEGAAAFKGLQVVTSQPVQIADGEIVYSPIDGDEAGSYVPNGWLVEGFNNNEGGELIVRPHVVCAKVRASTPANG